MRLMRGTSALVTVSVLALSLAVGTDVRAQAPTAEARGREIAREADRRAHGYGDEQARMEMILVDRRGEETTRELDLSLLEVSENEERSLIYFRSPRDIEGTALLTISYRDREEEQWLYLPALRRAKRISATGRSSPFMGSEFWYEDLTPLYPDQFDYVFVEEQDLEGQSCYVLERSPRYEGSGYSKQRVWIDTEEYRVLRVDSWDLRDRRLKTLTLDGYREYAAGVWRPAEAHMANLLTGDETRLRWLDYRFGTGLEESDFSRAALGRVR